MAGVKLNILLLNFTIGVSWFGNLYMGISQHNLNNFIDIYFIWLYNGTKP